jgi:DNA-binding HxlR family transcriptional regulator
MLQRMSHMPGQADRLPAADVYSARCPSRVALALIADKWAVLVAGCLVDGPKRHSWLRQRIGGISGKMLTRTLRELERAGLVERRIFPEVPPRVEYSLTPKGMAIVPLIEDMRRYGREWLGVDDCDASGAGREPATAVA